jgi:hypothetical protein
MSGHGVLMRACGQCQTRDDDVREVQGEDYCTWCREQLPTCDGCSEPMRESQPIAGDTTDAYRVCSMACLERVLADVGCADCQRIGDDVRDCEWYAAEDGTWHGGLYCRQCRP